MLILGIDTSGRQGSVALLRAQSSVPSDPLLALESVPLEGGQYSELLIPAVAGLLERHGAKKRDLGLIAVASGPGSFTGLRIAIATVKGLAEAFSTPVVAVSVLEAVALAGLAGGKVVSALDAQRTEVFFGEYLAQPEGPARLQTIRETIASFSGFASALNAANVQQIITPDESIAARLRVIAIEPRVLARPNAESYARIAFPRFCAGVRSDVATLDANYLRRSDAELFSAPRLGIAPA